MNYDIIYMKRALELAAHGRGNTSPNPMVGAVIVDSQGKIIGEGYHRKCGEGHAEVNAVSSVKDKSLLRDATMYVTLEPCSHWGKTPPCAKLIIDCGIPRVVVGAGDPFKEVAGRGIKMLRDAGVEVVEGVLADESRSLNARFITAHDNHRPFIMLKWAQSADGWLDSTRPAGHPEHFSTALSSALMHRWRSQSDAILVGSGTVLSDSPRLDCRLWPGRSPRPIVLDRRRRIAAERLHFAVAPIVLSDYVSLNQAMSELYDNGITSVLVEGGGSVLQSFVNEDLWDAARVEISPRVLGENGRVKAPAIESAPIKSLPIDDNKVHFYSNNVLFSVKNL
jgi:diaminohydroxyphosphoribosylaminopyrimidine deaminase/5-amino-6-(5-phosphoribosylamino)uracil reductase